VVLVSKGMLYKVVPVHIWSPYYSEPSYHPLTKTNIFSCCVRVRYLAAKSEADHYNRELQREQDEIDTVPDVGKH
jgi:hypothetical protein